MYIHTHDHDTTSLFTVVSLTETKRVVDLRDWCEVGMGSECIMVSNRKDEAIMREDKSDGYIKVCDYLMSPNILMAINVRVHITVRGREGRPGGEGEARERKQKKDTKKEKRKERDTETKWALDACPQNSHTYLHTFGKCGGRPLLPL